MRAVDACGIGCEPLLAACAAGADEPCLGASGGTAGVDTRGFGWEAGETAAAAGEAAEPQLAACTAGDDEPCLGAAGCTDGVDTCGFGWEAGETAAADDEAAEPRLATCAAGADELCFGFGWDRGCEPRCSRAQAAKERSEIQNVVTATKSRQQFISSKNPSVLKIHSIIVSGLARAMIVPDIFCPPPT